MSEGTTETGLVKLHAHDAAIAAVLPAMEYTTETPGKTIDKARKEAKSIRCEIENIRKALKADALEWGRKVDQTAKEVTARIEPVEQHCERLLEQQKRAAEAAAAAREAARLDALQQEREEQVQSLQLSERGRIIALQLASVAAMRQQSIEQWADTMQRLERIDAELAAADAEQARRDAERAEHERRMAEERAELERQQQEQRELQQRMDAERAELERQRQAMEAERLEAERKAAEAVAEKHRAAKAAELEQVKAEAERLRAEREAADVERLKRLQPMLDDVSGLLANATMTIGQLTLQRYGERVAQLVVDDLARALARIKDALMREIE